MSKAWTGCSAATRGGGEVPAGFPPSRNARQHRNRGVAGNGKRYRGIVISSKYKFEWPCFSALGTPPDAHPRGSSRPPAALGLGSEHGVTATVWQTDPALGGLRRRADRRRRLRRRLGCRAGRRHEGHDERIQVRPELSRREGWQGHLLPP